MKRKILLTGASGLLGSALVRKLVSDGHEITILSRSKTKEPEEGNAIIKTHWDYNNQNQWRDNLNGKEIIIHLSGANLNHKRWSAGFKKEIYNSRIMSTRALVNAIKSAEIKPQLLITASAVGIYGDRGEQILTENIPHGDDFLSCLCNDWENEAAMIEDSGVRRVSLRIAPVLSIDGGMLKQFLTPFKLFVGGPLGSGVQWTPWIHIEDLINVFIHVVSNESINGSLNCAAPGIVRMKEFTSILGNCLDRPSMIKIPKIVLRILFGEIANAITASQNVSVAKLISSNYIFKFAHLEKALESLLNKSAG